MCPSPISSDLPPLLSTAELGLVDGQILNVTDPSSPVPLRIKLAFTSDE